MIRIRSCKDQNNIQILSKDKEKGTLRIRINTFIEVEPDGEKTQVAATADEIQKYRSTRYDTLYITYRPSIVTLQSDPVG